MSFVCSKNDRIANVVASVYPRESRYEVLGSQRLCRLIGRRDLLFYTGRQSLLRDSSFRGWEHIHTMASCESKGLGEGDNSTVVLILRLIP